MGEAMLSELRIKIRKLTIPSLSNLNLEPETLLAALPFLKGVPRQSLQALAAKLKSKTISAESEIVRQGDVGDAFYLVARGVVRVYRQDAINDKRQRVATLIAGDYFGDVAFLTRAPSNATCKSVTACSLYELSRADFNAVMAEDPQLRDIFERLSAEDFHLDISHKAPVTS